MDSTIKWRPIWKVWIPIVLFLVPLILEGQMIGTSFVPYVYSLILIIYGIVYFFRIRMWEALLITITMAIAICWYFLAERPVMARESFLLIGLDFGDAFWVWTSQYITTHIWFAVLALNFTIFFTAGPRLTKAIDLERNAIKLFRLTARPVFEEGNGYTERPFDAGKHQYDIKKLTGFTSFLEDKKICLAQYPGNGIKYIFSMGASPLVRSQRDKLSHVFFANDGNISVFISKSDYKQYRKQYTFDQLCNMMGQTFFRFMEYYNDNNERRIITEIKTA